MSSAMNLLSIALLVAVASSSLCMKSGHCLLDIGIGGGGEVDVEAIPGFLGVLVYRTGSGQLKVERGCVGVAVLNDLVGLVNDGDATVLGGVTSGLLISKACLTDEGLDIDLTSEAYIIQFGSVQQLTDTVIIEGIENLAALSTSRFQMATRAAQLAGTGADLLFFAVESAEALERVRLSALPIIGQNGINADLSSVKSLSLVVDTVTGKLEKFVDVDTSLAFSGACGLLEPLLSAEQWCNIETSLSVNLLCKEDTKIGSFVLADLEGGIGSALTGINIVESDLLVDLNLLGLVCVSFDTLKMPINHLMNVILVDSDSD